MRKCATKFAKVPKFQSKFLAPQKKILELCGLKIKLNIKTKDIWKRYNSKHLFILYICVWVFCIAVNFCGTYLGFIKQCKYFENAPMQKCLHSWDIRRSKKIHFCCVTIRPLNFQVTIYNKWMRHQRKSLIKAIKTVPV